MNNSSVRRTIAKKLNHCFRLYRYAALRDLSFADRYLQKYRACCYHLGIVPLW